MTMAGPVVQFVWLTMMAMTGGGNKGKPGGVQVPDDNDRAFGAGCLVDNDGGCLVDNDGNDRGGRTRASLGGGA